MTNILGRRTPQRAGGTCYKRKPWSFMMLSLSTFITCSVAVAQQTVPSGPTMSQSEQMNQLRLEGIRARALPDTPGTGPYPALKEEVASLPDHVIYRPADLSRLGHGKLGILAWGNGGCQADGASSRLHLAQIASYGYLAIASGRILSGPGAPPQVPEAQPAPGVRRVLPPPATSARQLTQAIDWAVAENQRAGSPYFGKLDTKAIAVSGWSCGGLQAIEIAASDPRVRTAVIHNSGIPERTARFRRYPV